MIIVCPLVPSISFGTPNPAGVWEFSLNHQVVVPTNTHVRNDFNAGVGSAFRTGYGFWDSFSLEGEVEYDRLFRDEDSPLLFDKNLFNFGFGGRYTWDILTRRLNHYVYLLPGFSIDITKKVRSDVDVSYSLGTGTDWYLTHDLKMGPLIKFRHVVASQDIFMFDLGLAVTYLHE